MSVSAADAFAAIRFINSVVSKVKENREEIQRLASRLEYILLSLEDSRQRDVLQTAEYTDALTVLYDLIERSQRVLQRLLKRSLGDRTWNRDEITTELGRINLDVQNYMSVHTIKTIDTLTSESAQQYTSLSTDVKEIMVKLAEIDIRLKTPTGAPWSSGLLLEATQNVSRSTYTENPNATPISIDYEPDIMTAYSAATAGRTMLKVMGVRRNPDSPLDTITLTDIKVDAHFEEINAAIKDAGYECPGGFKEQELALTVTSGTSEYDATAPGGLKVSQSMPLLHWWNKYRAHHGLAPATTPSHSIARLADDSQSITATNVQFSFHRTLRVPDEGEISKLPKTMGKFRLDPVSKYAESLPESIVTKGGFIMAMFQREALWIEFTPDQQSRYPPGVNAISGVAKTLPAPPDSKQDYIVAGLQPWLDGVMTELGVIRQFVAMPPGEGYTIEEQVTGKSENSSFQFDVFPLRESPPGDFILYDGRNTENVVEQIYSPRLTVHRTPAELSLPAGARIGLLSHKAGFIPKAASWTLSAYRRQNDAQAGLVAHYYEELDVARRTWAYTSSVNDNLRSISLSVTGRARSAGLSLGLGAGGKIKQKIYQDPVSTRMYNEEAGERFHVHILTTEAWEDITGVVPHPSPISPETYKENKLPWFTLYDEDLPGLESNANNVLQNIKSVSQIDQQSPPTPSLLVDLSEERCTQHTNASATCVFRPCAHLACGECVKEAQANGLVCSQCGRAVDRFVGFRAPVKLEQSKAKAKAPGTKVLDDAAVQIYLHEQTANSRTVTIYHDPEDRVSPLFSRSSSVEAGGHI
ncbi:hypothetical protein B0H34DRAFT_796422 [Crassisporium funariophilum]|nr:hypothetical protein B0H34DRAFT_796422 [Crassisporium funariophilum]